MLSDCPPLSVRLFVLPGDFEGRRVAELRQAVAPEVKAHNGPHDHAKDDEEQGEGAAAGRHRVGVPLAHALKREKKQTNNKRADVRVMGCQSTSQKASICYS